MEAPCQQSRGGLGKARLVREMCASAHHRAARQPAPGLSDVDMRQAWQSWAEQLSFAGQAGNRQVDSDALCHGEAVEHAFERHLAPNPALLHATVGLAK